MRMSLGQIEPSATERPFPPPKKTKNKKSRLDSAHQDLNLFKVLRFALLYPPHEPVSNFN